MAFPVTRPPSPAREHINSADVDHLSTALHAALQTFSSGPSHPPQDQDMSREKDTKPYIDIIVNSNSLSLKGTGVDVESALLSGHVALYLTESTSIKEINLQFRGKARLPTPPNEPLSLNSSHPMYIICNHDWTFLEGEKRHSHTLKAGRHLFPFQLQLGGSLPSSISTTAYGGASVMYKLRAVAVRPGLAHNLHTAIPISIMRSFAPEALEYQQTLEIENTWPEKLMYSIMIPHKAWAIGDKLTAVVKFSPLAKGVRVLTVVTAINEITKLYGRAASQEHTRSVATAKHEIVNGKAVLMIEHHHRTRVPLLHGPYGSVSYTYSSSTPATPGLSNEHRTLSSGSLTGLAQDSSPSGRTSTSSDGGVGAFSMSAMTGSATASSSSSESNTHEEQDSNEDVVTTLSLTVPHSATPTHTQEPIIVSHRVRWSILISNLDGHTSELRCSLPLHILDHRLLDSARSNTAATRRIVLGISEVPEEDSHDMELPSYPAHIRDRVANMYLPDAATMRVTNPWVHSGVSPTHVSEMMMQQQQPFSGMWTPSGASSPLQAHPLSSQLPHVPTSGMSTPLDWVNSELLLSLSNEAPTPHPEPNGHSPVHSDPTSQPPSTPISRRQSRLPSRAPSPERHHHTTLPSTAASPITTVGGGGGAHQTFIHGGSQASRNLPGLFTNTMKPFSSSLTSPGWLSSRSSSLSNIAGLTSSNSSDHAHSYHRRPPPPLTPPADSTTTGAGAGAPTSDALMWHRAFTEVPDYGIASRGFIGGVPPLTSMRGLPSYEESSMREGDATSQSGQISIHLRRPSPRQAALAGAR